MNMIRNFMHTFIRYLSKKNNSVKEIMKLMYLTVYSVPILNIKINDS